MMDWLSSVLDVIEKATSIVANVVMVAIAYMTFKASRK